MKTTVNEQGEVISEAAPASSTAIAEFNPVEAGLAELRTLLSTASYDITTTAGLKTARELRQVCVGLRTSTDDVYERLNRPMLDRQSAMRALKKRIQDEVTLLEKPIDAAIKAQEAIKEEERKRRVAAEEARIKALRERIQAIATLPATAVRLDAQGITHLDHELSELVIDEANFQEFAEEVVELRTYIRGQLAELFQLALAREAETERVRVETLRLAQEREQQAREAVIRTRIDTIRSLPLKAIGKSADDIRYIISSSGIPTLEVYGSLLFEALAAHDSATAQLQSMLADRIAADQIAEAAAQREADAAAERKRDEESAIERQRVADEQHDARGRELKRQQDAFEAERVEAKRIQDEKDAALAAERKELDEKLKAMQPKPEPVVAAVNRVTAPMEPIDMATLLAPSAEATVVIEAAPVVVPAAPVVTAAQSNRRRPDDYEIVQALSKYFAADSATVIDWLRELDCDAVQQALDYEEIPA